MATATDAPSRRKLKPDELHAALKRQPLVGLKGAAAILGIAAPNVSRLKSQGRMRPVQVEGSADVYVKAEVVALAKVLNRERAKR